MDYVPKLEQMLQRLFDNLGCDHDDEFDDQMEQALWKINQLKGVDDAAVRAMEAWGCTVLPVSNDGMMQERMESLRAALVPNVGRRDAWPGRWYESAAHKVGLYLYCVLPFGQWLRWRWARWLHWTVMRPAGTALMAWATRRSQATDTPPNAELTGRAAAGREGPR